MAKKKLFGAGNVLAPSRRHAITSNSDVYINIHICVSPRNSKSDDARIYAGPNMEISIYDKWVQILSVWK